MTTESLMSEANSQNADAQQVAATPAAATTQQAAALGAEGQAATQQQATEAQPADGKPAAQGNPDATKAGESEGSKPVEGAPEQYEFTPPEGQKFDTSLISAYSEVAKELNLTQEAAQKMLEKMNPVLAARQSQQIEQARTDWRAAAETDKEFGGDKLDENLAVAKKGLDTFGTPELKALLHNSGLGNHPEIIRAFYRAGKAISEDGVVIGAPRAPGDGKSVADRLYDKTAAR